MDMQLDDATRDELAIFFARRFPTAEARARLAATAGLVLDPDLEAHEAHRTASSAWIALLALADERGALLQLADAACAAAPDDKNLAEARKLLRGAPPAPAGAGGRTVAVVGVALVLSIVGAGVVGAAWMAREPGEAAVVVAAVNRPVDAPVVAQPAPLPIEPVSAEIAVDGPPPVEAPTPVEASMAADAPPPVEAPPVPQPATEAPEAPPPAERTPAAAAPPAPSPRSRSTSCKGPPGEIVGWWYAGTTSPGTQGATIALPSSVNVREDYPRRDNGYAMRGRVLCWLPAGTSQRLSSAPVDIGQGHWWVPVAGGDL